jgi:hypothetical protein
VINWTKIEAKTNSRNTFAGPKKFTLRLRKVFQLAESKIPWQVQVYILKSGEQVGYFDEKKS